MVSESEILDGDPEDPQRLVLHLQATAGGCQWMLDRRSELLVEMVEWTHRVCRPVSGLDRSALTSHSNAC
jgi:hypothetical protein